MNLSSFFLAVEKIWYALRRSYSYKSSTICFFLQHFWPQRACAFSASCFLLPRELCHDLGFLRFFWAFSLMPLIIFTVLGGSSGHGFPLLALSPLTEGQSSICITKEMTLRNNKTNVIILIQETLRILDLDFLAKRMHLTDQRLSKIPMMNLAKQLWIGLYMY